MDKSLIRVDQKHFVDIVLPSVKHFWCILKGEMKCQGGSKNEFLLKNMSVAFRNKCGNLILPVDFGSKKVHGFGYVRP